jgi:hypothetical protein
VVNERTDLCRGANDNVMATDIRRRGELITRIFDIYNQKDTRSAERARPAWKLNCQRVIRQCGTVRDETSKPSADDGTEDAECSRILYCGKT